MKRASLAAEKLLDVQGIIDTSRQFPFLAKVIDPNLEISRYATSQTGNNIQGELSYSPDLAHQLVPIPPGCREHGLTGRVLEVLLDLPLLPSVRLMELSVPLLGGVSLIVSIATARAGVVSSATIDQPPFSDE